METPSSIRRITRSQAKERNDRSVLADITNDSPIVGLASGSLVGTPSSFIKKKNHPGSGEALLRGQVKILLQKVEEEAEHQKPSGLGLAPTPTNTPYEIVNQESQEGMDESDKCDVTRSLLFDFFDKTETSLEELSSCSSVLTQGSVFVGNPAEDEEEGEEEVAGGLVDELCEGFMSKMFVQKKSLPEFQGKHIRFLYDSDGELQGEEVTDDEDSSPSGGGVLRMNGLPIPQGKHLRFPEEQD